MMNRELRELRQAAQPVAPPPVVQPVAPPPVVQPVERARDAITQGIDAILGGPIPAYTNPSDIQHVNAYQQYRPQILSVLDIFTSKQAVLVSQVEAVFNQLRSTPEYADFATILRSAGILPPPGTNVAAFCERFTPRRCQIVVQGGEAVNRYTGRGAVPTHDCDVRVITPGFSYTKQINDREISRENLVLHAQFKFVLFSLLQSVLGQTVAVRNGWLPGMPTVYEVVMQNPSLVVQYFAEHLWLIVPNGGSMSVMDIFAPRNAGQLGNSPKIAEYFDSALHEQIPVFEAIASIPIRRTTYLPANQVDIVSFGYLIWDTLRMMLASPLIAQAGQPAKPLKYRQKFIGLLTALLDPRVSSKALALSRANNIDGNPLRFLGGKRMPQEGGEEPEIQMDTPAARTFTTEFLQGKAKLSSTPSSDEIVGFMNALSVDNPDFKEYELPPTPDEVREMAAAAAPRPDTASVDAFLASLNTSAPQATGGRGRTFRRSTLRNKRRTTRQKKVKASSTN
jgi:hypothetical protein